MGALADFRDRVALALAPSNGDEWNTQPLPVDAIEPPAYMLIWADPWLVPSTFCDATAQLDVIVVSARMDPAPGMEILETLVETALDRLAHANVGQRQVGAPGPLTVGGLTYQACRILVSSPVTIGGNHA